PGADVERLADIRRQDAERLLVEADDGREPDEDDQRHQAGAGRGVAQGRQPPDPLLGLSGRIGGRRDDGGVAHDRAPTGSATTVGTASAEPATASAPTSSVSVRSTSTASGISWPSLGR